MAEDDHRLLTLQLTYEKELANQNVRFAGLSVNQFIYQLLLANVNKRAERVRAEWKVPDKRCVPPTFPGISDPFGVFSSQHPWLVSLGALTNPPIGSGGSSSKPSLQSRTGTR